VSISTTRVIPTALGLPTHDDMAATGGRLGTSAVVAAGGSRSAGAAGAGKGAGLETEVFCQKIAPKTAKQTAMASADAIVARRMSHLRDAFRPQSSEFTTKLLILGQYGAPL
jgi:hypothetical protein